MLCNLFCEYFNPFDLYNLNELYRNMISSNGIQVQKEKQNFIVLIPRSPSNFEILGMPRNLGSDDGNDQGNDTKKNITSFYLGYFVIMFTRLKLSGVLVFPDKSYCVASLSLPSPSSLLSSLC